MFEGMYVAIVTPFTASGEIDEAGLRKLVEFHVARGTDGLVPCGTTGENPTFTPEEHERVLSIVVEAAAGRLTVIGGAGSNATSKAVSLAEGAERAGCDGLLVITPFYNKPQPDGLVAHFRAVAGATSLPLVMYNVPGRTGVNMRPETVARLADVPNIVAIKEASGDVNQSSEIVASVGDRIGVLAGDDALTLPIMAVGGKGVVSVLGNVVPERMCALVRAAAAGDMTAARCEHLALYELAQAMFVESNPVPVKHVMSRLGLPAGPVRPPLAPLRPESAARLDRLIERLGLTAASSATLPA